MASWRPLKSSPVFSNVHVPAGLRKSKTHKSTRDHQKNTNLFVIIYREVRQGLSVAMQYSQVNYKIKQ